MRSDNFGLDRDVAMCGLGVRADSVGRVDQLLRDVAINAGQADIETRSQEEGGAIEVQVDLASTATSAGSLTFLWEAASS